MAAAGGEGVDLAQAMNVAPLALSDWHAVAPVALCIFFGALLLMFRKETRRQPAIAIGALLLLIANNVALLARVLDGGTLVMTMGGWLPPFGIAFTVDVLGAIFTLTASVVALAGAVYAAGSLGTSETRYGFYPFVILLTGGVSAAFLTGDIFNLYVWFEVLLISSFGLLILGSGREQIDGAVKYGFLNLVATTLFLVTTGLLYGAFGTLNMADIARKAPALAATAPLMTITALYLLALGMKAAAFPANFWLPASYHTPRIVVSALFAGLLTKVGVYALLRVLITLFPAARDQMAELVAWIAALTMIAGALGALAQSDLRRLLAYTVISGIGTMLAGLAIASPLGLSGTVLYAIHSMIAMTALFLLAGIVMRITGTHSLHRLSGLYSGRPLLAAVALALFLAVCGLPPFSGLWPKAMLVKASLDGGAWWLAASILLSSFLATIAYGRVFLLAFWRDQIEPWPAPDHEKGETLTVAATVALTAIVVVLGVWPEPAIAVANRAALSLLDVAGYVHAVFPQGSASPP
jgi:multicomponent Na+:H+ antiporter subunit D